MSEKLSQGAIKPLLAQHAVPRTGEPQIEGRFSKELDVWVVDGPSGPRPIVETHTGIGQTTTLTKVRAEQDDTDVGASAMASTTTFTRVNAEGDDVDISTSSLLEITTKTMAQIEGDDQKPTIEALALREGGEIGARAVAIR